MRNVVYIVLASAVLFSSNSLFAVTLNDAIAHALENNPKIHSYEYRLRSTKSQMNTNIFSTIAPSISYTASSLLSSNLKDVPYYPSSVESVLNITQPIFNGGKSLTTINQTKYVIKAEEAQCYAVRQSVILETVNAYMDVLAASEVNKLSIHNEKALAQHLAATRKRFSVGEVTRTDVAQAESRLAIAHSETIKATGQLKAANARYEHVIGIAPMSLVDPMLSLPHKPDSADQVLQKTLNYNASLKSSYYGYKAAKQAIGSSIADSLPSVNLSIDFKDVARYGADGLNTIGISLSVPILQRGGANISGIVQSHYTAQQRLYDYREAIRDVEERSLVGWEQLVTASSVLDSSKEALKAASVALEGIKQEVNLNLRTTLDLLDSEREVFQVQLGVVNAQKSYVTSLYSLLSVMGDL